MLEPVIRVARLLLTEDRAQATVEYSLLLFFTFTAVLLLTQLGLVMGGLSAWYSEISSLVCLPIP